MNIVVCDDNCILCEEIKEAILECFRVLKAEKPIIDMFYSGEELLASKTVYDFAFLDVEMKGISGIAAGRRLYEKNKNILIFVVTAYGDYIDEALKFHAYRFFQKPVNKKRLLLNLKDALEVYNHMHAQVVIEEKDRSRIIDTKDIVMIEATDGATVVYTEAGTIYSTSSLAEIAEQLQNYPYFIQTNRSFLVNAYFVSSFGKDFVAVYHDRYKAKLTRRNYRQFKNRYMALMGMV